MAGAGPEGGLAGRGTMEAGTVADDVLRDGRLQGGASGGWAGSAREQILERVRGALGRTSESRARALADIAAALVDRGHGPRPPAAADLVERFKRESARMSSTLDTVTSLQAVPEAVSRYLAAQGLPRSGVVWPSLAGLDWARAGLTLEAREAREGDLVGVTGCFCAMAETGTVMTCSAPESPATASLLPETHVVVVPATRIVQGMEEAWQLAREEYGMALPRAVNFISGPSRTGDIEMNIVLGAHGPYRVHIVMVRE